MLATYIWFGFKHLFITIDACFLIISPSIFRIETSFCFFLHFRDPNDDTLPEWPEYDTDNQSYLVLSTSPTVRNVYNPERHATWMNFIQAANNDNESDSFCVLKPWTPLLLFLLSTFYYHVLM